MKVALNPPLEVVVTVPKVLPPNVMVTVEIGAKPVLVIVTVLPTVPDVGLRVIVGERLEPEVLKSHSQLSSTPLESKQSKKLPS